MIDDISDIAAYYDNNAVSEHERLDRHQLEYDLTWRYLDQYLPTKGKVLEIGSATGRYSLELARRGYDLTCVDLSTKLLGECRKNLAGEGFGKKVRFIQADARDLSQIQERDYDAALIMGPLYHLVEEPDRIRALKEVQNRLKAGGLLFSAFISRLGILGDLMKNVTDWIEKQVEVQSVMERGKDSEHYPPGNFRGYFACASEITPLHEKIGFETLSLAGVEPVISEDDESYNTLQGKQRELWLDLLYKISTDSSILGASRHLLYIGKKSE